MLEQTEKPDIYTMYGKVNSKQRRRVMFILRHLRKQVGLRKLSGVNRALAWRKACMISYFSTYFEFKSISSLTDALSIKRKDFKLAKGFRFRAIFNRMFRLINWSAQVFNGSVGLDFFWFVTYCNELRRISLMFRRFRQAFTPAVLTTKDLLTKEWLVSHASDKFILDFLHGIGRKDLGNQQMNYVLQIMSAEDRKGFFDLFALHHPVMDVILGKVLKARDLIGLMNRVETLESLKEILNSGPSMGMNFDFGRKTMPKGLQAKLLRNRLDVISSLAFQQGVDNVDITRSFTIGGFNLSLVISMERRLEFVAKRLPSQAHIQSLLNRVWTRLEKTEAKFKGIWWWK
jgi:hypothetical protein